MDVFKKIFNQMTFTPALIFVLFSVIFDSRVHSLITCDFYFRYNNYMLIQEKYKNHLCVTIPNIGEPNSLKFSDYVPIQPLETFWKPPRPPSRKKKKPKEYEKYPLGCTHCPKRFTSEILQSFHVKVYHNAHFQVSNS